MSRHHRRHQLLAAVLRSDHADSSSSTRAKCARRTTRGSRSSRRASGSPAARAARARSRESPVYGALRAIDPATGERKWEFRYLDSVDRRPADDGVGPDLQRRRRRQPAGARLATAASCSGATRWARRCTARRRSPTCSTAASTCSCPRAPR